MLSSTLQRRAGLQSTNDYNRYRSYTVHRVKKLRRRAQLSLRPKANTKPKALTDPKHWPIAVLLAERNWASAMEAKSALEADAASPRLRDHMVSKYAKAIKQATQAASLANPVFSATEQLEIAVYIALLEGDAAVEKQQWEAAALCFSKARVGLVALGGIEVYTDYISAKVDPILRLAFAQTRQDRDVSIPQAAQLAAQKDSDFATKVRSVDASAIDADITAPSKQLGEIEFRSHKALVKDADLAQAILDAQTKDRELASKISTTEGLDPTSFDSVLASWQDAVGLVTDLLPNQSDQDLHIVNTYIQFNLLFRRIQRDNCVASKEQGGNAVRIYDAVLQSCTSMSELPGVFSDDELTSSIESMQLYFQTLRTLATAETHPKGSREVLALVNLANKRLQNYHDITADLPVRSEQLDQLRESVAKKLVAAHGLTVIFSEAANRSAVKGSVASNVSAFPVAKRGSKLVAADLDGGNVEPVPVKPVFYDIAYNYVRNDTVPPQEDVPMREASVESTESRSGKKKLFGIF